MRTLIMILSFFAYTSLSYSQNNKDSIAKYSFPIMIAFSAHSYSWPILKSFVTPIQPGFKTGTEYMYSAKKNHKILQTLTLGYFRNPEFLEAYYLNSYFTYRYTAPFHLFVDGAIGAGYFHRRHTREVFKVNDKGVFESKTDWGSPGAQVGLNLGAGYAFNLKNKQLDLFINYEWFINYPHVKGDIPFLSHSLYHIGIKYYPFK
ncbi:MAG TPA: hypothetical protein DEA97_05385 [Bacteroidales bacterium]|nr:hypothetical protein [Bacteroidales bacterium]